MESITIKVEPELAREIDRAMKPLYSTKTEFIREAIRDKIKREKDEEFTQKLRKHLGMAKKRTSDKELRQIREEVGKMYFKEHGIELD